MESAKKGARFIYVFLNFCAAFLLGLIKGALVGPVAALVLITGNVGVLIGLFPANVYCVLLTLLKTKQINLVLKFVFLLALPILFGLWLALGIVGSVLVGIGYGFFTPWIATFEAFRRTGKRDKLFHCITDGTWQTIRGSCTVVRDFADICYHSVPVYLKELREETLDTNEPHTIRLVEIPKCIVVGLLGVVVEVPLYTLIALLKSPYMLFKGWQRLLQDLIRGEGPFLETSCVPIAGLAILVWPLVVIGSVALAFLAGIFIGLYGSVIVYQERSFRSGISYLVAMVSEFDEDTNDWLYLKEGSFIPRPRYREKKATGSAEASVRSSIGRVGTNNMTPPALLVPSLAPSRSVREAIQEVKVVQVWRELMKGFEDEGKDLLDAGAITCDDLKDWCKSTGSNQGSIIGIGLPSYAILRSLLEAIKAGVDGFLLSDGMELNQLNRPQDRMLDWFFHPVMVLKEQIKIIEMEESELRFLEKETLFGNDAVRKEAWKNGAVIPTDPVRTAQIQAMSRRLVGMTRSLSKLPTYRRRFQHVVKFLMQYSIHKGCPAVSRSASSLCSAEVAEDKV